MRNRKPAIRWGYCPVCNKKSATVGLYLCKACWALVRTPMQAQAVSLYRREYDRFDTVRPSDFNSLMAAIVKEVRASKGEAVIFSSSETQVFDVHGIPVRRSEIASQSTISNKVRVVSTGQVVRVLSLLPNNLLLIRIDETAEHREMPGEDVEVI